MDNIIFKAIIDHAIDGIVITDADGRITQTNLSAGRMFGYEPDDLSGREFALFFKKPGIPAIDELQSEPELIRQNGTLFPARITVCEVTNDDVTVFASFIQDISTEKRVEERLHYHAQHLEETVKERTDMLTALITQLELTQEETQGLLIKEKQIGQMKSRFVSMASHEFRSPLSRIQLSASIIESFYDRLDRPKIMEHLQKIKSSVGELANTLDDFLSVEKIDSGRVKPSVAAFDLKIFVEDVCEEMAFLKRDGQQIVCYHAGDSDVFSLDKALLKHCLANLLSNACKYSDNDGFIEVMSIIDHSKIWVSVTDNGIGIPANDRGRLFEAFFRAGNAEEISGTGLGLNIVKSYAELMGGEVSYAPVEPRGSKFILSFPINRPNFHSIKYE